MYLHQNIRHLLKSKGISVYRMGCDLNMSERTAAEIAYKESDATRLKTVMRVAEYFSVTLDNLVYKDLSKENK